MKDESFIMKTEQNPVCFKISEKQRQILDNRVEKWHELDDKTNHNQVFIKILRDVVDLKPAIDEMLGSDKKEINKIIEKLLLLM